jgi:effector-binding domain-containing protein
MPEVTEVTIVRVEAAPIAAVRSDGRVAAGDIPRELIALLDRVWPVLRAQPDVPHGHNVAIYWPDGSMTAGVQVGDGFEPRDGVELLQTPAGRAATAAHLGPYAQIGRTHDAVREWCAGNGHTTSSCWEVYGDWEEDEARLRTDVVYLLR